MVVEAEIFPAVLTCLKDPDEYVKKNVATLIREIAKHTPEVTKNNLSKMSFIDLQSMYYWLLLVLTCLIMHVQICQFYSTL